MTDEFVNIFQQMHDFFEHFYDVFGQGINSIDELPNIMREASDFFRGALSCVHPRFIPLLSFALGVALLFKFLRIDGLH